MVEIIPFASKPEFQPQRLERDNILLTNTSKRSLSALSSVLTTINNAARSSDPAVLDSNVAVGA